MVLRPERLSCWAILERLEDDIIKTIEHLKECRPDHYTITTTYPITGTPLYEAVRSRLTVQPAWENSTGRDLDFERTYPRRYYDYALRRLYNEVELNKPTFKSEVQQVEELYRNILPRVSSTPDISSGDCLTGARPFRSPHRSLC